LLTRLPQALRSATHPESIQEIRELTGAAARLQRLKQPRVISNGAACSGRKIKSTEIPDDRSA